MFKNNKSLCGRAMPHKCSANPVQSYCDKILCWGQEDKRQVCVDA